MKECFQSFGFSDPFLHIIDNHDINCLIEGLKVFDKICQGNKEGGVIANMDIPDRFRWLTAVKSSCIQVSRPHPGFSTDLDNTLERLFKELVL